MKILQITLIALFTACFISCGDNKAAKEISSKIVKNFETIPDIIKDVKDVGSAKVANEKLSQVGKNINAILLANKDKKISKSKSEEMLNTMKEQLSGVQSTIEAKLSSLTIADPAVAQELNKGFKALKSNMSGGIQ